MPTKTRAAIIREQPGPFEVVDVELDDPRQGEILVKMVVSGLCHSDYHLVTGDSTAGTLPMVGGHEGTGIVQEVGPNTPGWEVGDKVVFSFIASCGKCRWCNEGMTNLCDLGAFLMRGSRFTDIDSYRVSLPDGTPVSQMCGLGTFAGHTVVDVNSAVKLPADAPLEKLWLLGCGVGTGWGSAVYSAETRPGDAIIIMGVGGVGINAVQGAKHAGATAIIAVDPVEFKRQKALEVGATHAFATIAEATEFVKSITNGQGADRAIVTVGVVSGQDVADAFYAIRKAGTVVVTGIAPASETSIPVPVLDITRYQKRIQGAIYGSSNPRADIPRQYAMYQAGQLKLDELISGFYSLDDVEQGYVDLLEGRNIRGGIRHD
ncbi:NDMA-dependent alcohol dehydrogenase [Microbacterium sp. zg.B48]|uniref:NDMA-dependent alcohol dehydrogenase n=1 Tax=unclassified Microbacterium TaxID=2609290 RepID=UPI00214B067F|nr:MULTISPECIES: NDMA-dependent alcohol dehydrogenase [unclassified Microbacterium]MCR2763054.1 NDMA-dependent alcohol dehydrogenase [Microbacterium sp. zg.B48]MCR2808631.1 NDMA-dependent alcohol dehydrogenase [Microbacterium sp. zg.B185]WIM18935.1 NDMA-dependent alcohol dehydrogenase [Microbacterium sp. zg-B185]